MTQTDIRVTGMTCEHCVRAVTDELKLVPGVQGVSVELVSGGDSPVHITSDEALTAQAVAEAIDEAGYAISA
ncbi:heavy-metal-associated domain-containing protein [Leekyejoonella antrihumi]|uniref:Heavy-metal-associated domain-containing protein n=1 Tax=Leekyejoonella antrihumi TaxID=1660198 RepID=A0A563E6X3_9MICO|nr:heavy metal-associated domain-containing protein [Leekyejoonella antrihumi]TWP38175.1 heavy-metal-associated domain-containing protein [Leekyejoonella antrihumi]